MEMDLQEFRKKQFKVRSLVSLPIAAYFGYALSGISTGYIDLHHIYKSYFWCLMHPKDIWFDKAWGFAALGILIWGIVVAEAWIKLSYNLMHGKEYGDSKWGDIFKFNDKYASDVTLFQQMGNLFSQCVKSGMKNAKAKGKKIGRPETTSDTLPDKFWKYYKQYQENRINISEFSRLMNCSRATIYKYIRLAN